MNQDALSTVRAWHEALNAGAVEELIALSSDDVEVGGPRGIGRGSQLLREWFGRAGIRLAVVRVFCRDERVVVVEEASWLDPQGGGTGDAQTVASAFTVKDSRVTSVVRYTDLESALEASGLTQADSAQAGT